MDRYEYWKGTNMILDTETDETFDYAIELFNKQDDKIKELENALCELNKLFFCMSETLVDNSKYNISNQKCLDDLRKYLSKSDKIFDDIKEKFGLDYFIKLKKKLEVEDDN